MQHIHQFHMDVSYNQNSNAIKFVESAVANQGYKFITNFCIAFNENIQFDIGLNLIKGYLDNYKHALLSSTLEGCTLYIPLDPSDIKNEINKRCRDYSNCIVQELDYLGHYYDAIYNNFKIHNDKQKITLELFDFCSNYCNLKNQDDFLKYKIMALLMFIGLNEWFSGNIYIMLLSVHKSSAPTFLIGEMVSIDVNKLENIDDVVNFIKEEYNSHAVTIIFTNSFVTLIDSDYDKSCREYYTKLNQIARHLNIKCKKIKLLNPVQNITDDNYCIFHCLFIILNLSNISHLNFKKIKHSIMRCDKNNIDITIKDIEYKIIEFKKLCVNLPCSSNMKLLQNIIIN